MGGNEKTYRVGHDDPLRYRVKKETLTGMGDGPFYLVLRRTWWLMARCVVMAQDVGQGHCKVPVAMYK